MHVFGEGGSGRAQCENPARPGAEGNVQVTCKLALNIVPYKDHSKAQKGNQKRGSENLPDDNRTACGDVRVRFFACIQGAGELSIKT